MWDNKNFIIGIVLVTVIFALGISVASKDISEKITLDTDSEEFLDKYLNNTKSNGIEDFEETAKDINKEENPIIEKLKGVAIISDVLGAINFLSDVADGIWNYIKFIYNIPSFLIEGLGIPLGWFSPYLNVIIFVMFIGIILFLVGLIK